MRFVTALVCGLLLAGVTRAGFAEEQGAVAKTAFFKGTVASVVVGDAIEGSVSSIIVQNDKGGTLEALVRSPFSIYDHKGLMLRLRDIKPGDAVTVEYFTNKEGVNRVVAISVTQSK